MNDDQWKIINERLNNIQSAVDDTNRNQGLDREDLHKMTIRLGAMEQQLDQVWLIINNLPERSKTVVMDAVKPVQKEARELKEEIATKKFVMIDKAKLKNKFWFW